jgi:hypothetical protein
MYSSLNLPIVDLPYEWTGHEGEEFDTYLYYTNDLDKKSYSKLLKWIKEFLCDDCWAMTINNEVIFNDYPEDISFTKRIENEWFRNQIYRNPHESLLCHFPFLNKDQNIRIYLSGSHPWVVQIHFKHKMKCFQISFQQSKKFYEYVTKINLDSELDEIVKRRNEYYGY